jgi:hypothetical protein
MEISWLKEGSFDEESFDEKSLTVKKELVHGYQERM